MILGIGTDLCDLRRLAPAGRPLNEDFIAAVFRQSEIRRGRAHPHPARWFAAAFAAKESVIKALAQARGQGTFWQDIEIGNDGSGNPVVSMHGRIDAFARELGVRRIHLSWSHCPHYATACAIVSD